MFSWLCNKISMTEELSWRFIFTAYLQKFNFIQTEHLLNDNSVWI